MSHPGRPPRTEQPSSKLIVYRVTDEEHERLKRAAAVNLQDLSNFARDVALDAASETLEEETTA